MHLYQKPDFDSLQLSSGVFNHTYSQQKKIQGDNFKIGRTETQTFWVRGYILSSKSDST